MCTPKLSHRRRWQSRHGIPLDAVARAAPRQPDEGQGKDCQALSAAATLAIVKNEVDAAVAMGQEGMRLGRAQLDTDLVARASGSLILAVIAQRSDLTAQH